ncbi:MAG: outer membrane PBP1 activator LpoA protein, partial [Arenicella sp.]
MHPQLNSRMKLLGITIAVTLLASCASAPIQVPAKIEARDIVVSEPVLSEVDNAQYDELSTPIENRFNDQALQAEELNSSRAEYYGQQSQTQGTRSEQIDATLSAAEYYIQAQDFIASERASNELYYDQLSTIQADRLMVINAYSAYAKGQHVQAITLLKPLWNRAVETPVVEGIDDPEALPTIAPQAKLSIQQVDALLLGSFSFQALGDYDSAIATLIKRERSLVGSTRSETTRYIWQVINSLPIQRRQIIFDSTQNTLVKNRIEQSLTTVSAPTPELPQQFTQWREETDKFNKQTIEDTWNNNSPSSIAILLPITSKFNLAAQAVKDGIDYQHNANGSSFRPQLRYYDIGDNPALSTQYYAAAVQSGADFIIGPLGKEYANQ